MHLIHSQIGKLVKSFLIRRGFSVVQLSSRYGVEPFSDIKRLSEKWNYSIRKFFDVGANEGQTALNAMMYFPQARIFSFEPHPATFSALLSKLGERANLR